MSNDPKGPQEEAGSFTEQLWGSPSENELTLEVVLPEGIPVVQVGHKLELTVRIKDWYTLSADGYVPPMEKRRHHYSGCRFVRAEDAETREHISWPIADLNTTWDVSPEVKHHDESWGLDHAAPEQKVIDGEMVTDHTFKWIMRSNGLSDARRQAIADAQQLAYTQRRIRLDLLVTACGPTPAHTYNILVVKEIILWEKLHSGTVKKGRDMLLYSTGAFK